MVGYWIRQDGESIIILIKFDNMVRFWIGKDGELIIMDEVRYHGKVCDWTG